MWVILQFTHVFMDNRFEKLSVLGLVNYGTNQYSKI